MRGGNHRQLRAWQLAMELAKNVHLLARRLPAHERFGLAAQLTRAAVSVPSNIAEGHGRLHAGDYLHHLSIARGSVSEVETQIELVAEFGYVSQADVSPTLVLTDRVSRMLTRLASAVRDGRVARFAARSTQPAVPPRAPPAAAP
jgi:four helix bundle protein